VGQAGTGLQIPKAGASAVGQAGTGGDRAKDNPPSKTEENTTYKENGGSYSTQEPEIAKPTTLPEMVQRTDKVEALSKEMRTLSNEILKQFRDGKVKTYSDIQKKYTELVKKWNEINAVRNNVKKALIEYKKMGDPDDRAANVAHAEKLLKRADEIYRNLVNPAYANVKKLKAKEGIAQYQGINKFWTKGTYQEYGLNSSNFQAYMRELIKQGKHKKAGFSGAWGKTGWKVSFVKKEKVDDKAGELNLLKFSDGKNEFFAFVNEQGSFYSGPWKPKRGAAQPSVQNTGTKPNVTSGAAVGGTVGAGAPAGGRETNSQR
jgi:hypothetical protein